MRAFSIASAVTAMIAVGCLVAGKVHDDRKSSAFLERLASWGLGDILIVDSVGEEGWFSLTDNFEGTVRFRPGSDIRTVDQIVQCPSSWIKNADANEYSCSQGDWGIYLEAIDPEHWRVSVSDPPWR